MEGNELRRMLVRAAVKKGVQDVRRDADRALRKLSDMGTHFSTGETQKRLYKMLQTQLIGQDSAFHALALRTVRQVRMEYFEQLGVDLGYNSWTQGAKTIRAREEACGHHIPWCLFMDLRGEVAFDPERVLAQAEKLGIYCCVIRGDARIGGLFPALRTHGECAVFLLLDSADMPVVNWENVPNVMPLLPLEHDGTSDAAKELLQRQCWYGLWTRYDEEHAQHILSGEAERIAQDCGATVLCAVAEQPVQEVLDYCETTYSRANNGCLLVDMRDIYGIIDRNISGRVAPLTILADGTVRTGEKHWPNLNLHNMSLADVLLCTMPRMHKE